MMRARKAAESATTSATPIVLNRHLIRGDTLDAVALKYVR